MIISFIRDKQLDIGLNVVRKRVCWLIQRTWLEQFLTTLIFHCFMFLCRYGITSDLCVNFVLSSVDIRFVRKETEKLQFVRVDGG